MEPPKSVFLCGPNAPQGCPEIKVESDTVLIKDDDGNTAKVTRAQWEILRQKVRAGEL